MLRARVLIVTAFRLFLNTSTASPLPRRSCFFVCSQFPFPIVTSVIDAWRIHSAITTRSINLSVITHCSLQYICLFTATPQTRNFCFIYFDHSYQRPSLRDQLSKLFTLDINHLTIHLVSSLVLHYNHGLLRKITGWTRICHPQCHPSSQCHQLAGGHCSLLCHGRQDLRDQQILLFRRVRARCQGYHCW
jgi:hypothetical protein